MSKYRVLVRSRIIAPILLLACLVQPGLSLANEQGNGSYFSASFEQADIKEFIQTVGANLNLTMITDPVVRGEVTVRAREPLSREQYYQLFQTVLSVQGFTAVQVSPDVVKVIPDKDGRTSALPVIIGDNPGQRVHGAEMVTWVLPVKHVPVRELSPILRQLVDSTGSVVHYEPSNMLIISGEANNLERIAEIVQRVDQGGSRQVEIITLENTPVSEMERILTTIYVPAGTGQRNTNVPVITSNDSSNQLIISAEPDVLARMKSLVVQMDGERRSNGNIRVFYLHYAKAEDLKKVLDGVAKMVNTPKGATGDEFSIETHAQTNALVINARPDLMQAMESVIGQLDIRRAQVMVEAIIAEVSEGDGINLSFQLANQNGTSLMQFQDGSSVPISELLIGMRLAEDKPGSTVISENGAVTENPATQGDFTALAAALAKVAGSAFTITSGDWSALLQAVSSSSESNVLATPSLMTLDNEEAMFVVGDEVPTITGTTTGTGSENPFQTIERKEVGIKLNVTPQINAGDSIKLTIEQEVSNVNGRTPVDVTFSTRKVKTSVLVNTGDTVVIGGLLDENVQESVSKVPLLGDIPILGHLFRSTSSRKTKRNLMVFLRPTIIRDDETMSALSGQKYTLMRAQQLEKQARGIELMPNTSTPVLPEQTSAAELLRTLQEEMRLKQAPPPEKKTRRQKVQERQQQAQAEQARQAEQQAAQEAAQKTAPATPPAEPTEQRKKGYVRYIRRTGGQA